MNTNSVKNILIGMFLIIIIVLGVLIFIGEQRFALPPAREAAIHTLMERSGISFTVQAEITRSFRPMRQLLMHPYQFDLNSITARFFGGDEYSIIEDAFGVTFISDEKHLTFVPNGNILIFVIPLGYATPEFLAAPTMASAQALATQYAQYLMGQNINMTLHSAELGRGGDYTLTYFGTFGGYDILNNRLMVRITDRGITRMEFSYFHVEGFSGAQVDIYSGDEAILALMNQLRQTGVIAGFNDSSARIEIDDMRLIYYLENAQAVGQGQPANPGYVFTVIIDQTRFNYIFNAYTNSFIRYEVVR